jgi:hypothetical protein
MSDRAYFQALYDTALDFTMKAFYAAAVRERNDGALGPCKHPENMLSGHMERSYGTTYYWTECVDCGAILHPKCQTPW